VPHTKLTHVPDRRSRASHKTKQMRARSSPCVSRNSTLHTGLSPTIHSTVCIRQSQACIAMFSFDLFFPNCAQGSIICTRFLINHLPFPPDFFSRLYNSPRFFNSPQPSHSLPLLFTMHSTTIHPSPASVGGMLNTTSLLWLLRDDRIYDIMHKAI
jgi:hypothetical protein